ncbi:MAG: dTMP kinase [Magnetococcales bacterium]|nr:dTMP kinase [Magnetococcales bacterium]
MERGTKFGKFITFEGGEGSGKSTQIQNLARHLRDSQSMAGVEVVTSREPGGSKVAEQIRELLVTGDPNSLEPKAELMLVMAARIEHVQKLIYPILRQGGWVLCDRFVDSTIAYQGYGRGMSTEHLIMLNQWALSGLRPDLTLLLDIDPAVGLLRTQPRSVKSRLTGVTEDRFEQAGDEFHQNVNEGFRTLAKVEPERIKLVDASQSEAMVEKDIWEIVSGVFPNL